ncbi:sensor histidine kinase [Acrocarpospora corrugata]|uniref:sensor histidine kinase n=1 Tax=Acrocarpospora corrugata TaxID=35763 RepID=UPI0014793350|nr:sensor histidine kinase [Acrocarpospora corrugata]
MLILAALIFFAALAAGRSDLAGGLRVAAVLVVIPAALRRVVRPGPAPSVMRWADILATLVGLAAVYATMAGFTRTAVLLVTVCGVVMLGAGLALFEMTSGDERRQVLWMILGLVVSAPTSLLLFVFISGAAPGVALLLGVVAAVLSLSLPLATAIAVINPRVVDVRAVLANLTVLTIMFAFGAALYAGTEATILALTGDIPPRGVRVLIAVGVAAGFHPMLRWVRTSVDEMLFGGRADPIDTLTRLGTHLAAGSSPPKWLDTLRTALAVRGVALRQGEKIIASSGEFGASLTVVTELRTDAAHVGDLVVALPADDLRPAPATSAVLSLVSVPLAQALHAARLTEELRASRGQAVNALEEERRRMRHDLHDGLGPTLTGIAYSADAAANLLRSAPDDALEILRDLRGGAGEAIAEIRRIVYGLRPRALDELGLVGAVRQQIAPMRTADGRPLAVTIHTPEDLPDLPAAVEVAAYRMTVEAVTNAARHSGAAEATITFALTPGPALRIEVHDQGHNTANWTPGVGLRSMRDRVEQIGGTLTVDATANGATITANIPLDASPSAQLDTN